MMHARHRSFLVAVCVMALGCREAGRASGSDSAARALGWPQVTLHDHFWDHGDWAEITVDAAGGYVRRARGSTGGAASKSTIETCSGQLDPAAVAPLLDAVAAAKLGDDDALADALRRESKASGSTSPRLRYVAAKGAAAQGPVERDEALKLHQLAQKWKRGLPRDPNETCSKRAD